MSKLLLPSADEGCMILGERLNKFEKVDDIFAINFGSEFLSHFNFN